MRALAEATLALVLFSDASRIDFELRRDIGVPLRLLGIGLPLTIALGALAAGAIFDVLTVWKPSSSESSWPRPTPPSARRSSLRRASSRIRQGLNIESGLNDEICVPLLFAAVAAADVESHISEGRSGLELLFEEIGYGIVGGVLGGLLIRSRRRIWRAQRPDRRHLAPGDPGRQRGLAYGIAVALHGSGFIAAFVAGLVFRASDQARPRGRQPAHRGGRRRAQRVTFILFGAILLGPALVVTWESSPST